MGTSLFAFCSTVAVCRFSVPVIALCKSIIGNLSVCGRRWCGNSRLVHAVFDLPWSPSVSVSDSCLSGFAAHSARWDIDQVKAVGSVSERWRFRSESAVSARGHAVQSSLKNEHVIISKDKKGQSSRDDLDDIPFFWGDRRARADSLFRDSTSLRCPLTR